MKSVLHLSSPADKHINNSNSLKLIKAFSLTVVKGQSGFVSFMSEQFILTGADKSVCIFVIKSLNG